MRNFFIRKLIGARRRIVDAYWERRFEADTTGLRPGTAPDAHWYVTVPYSSIFQVLRALELGPDDVLVDLGCGKGRVLLCASRLAIAKAIGVELAQDVYAVAQGHVGQVKDRRCSLEVVNQNVLAFDYRQGTAYYLFDPFGPETVRGVLAKLREGLARAPRRVRLAFILSVAPASRDELAACDWLECYRQFDVFAFGAKPQSVSLWRNRE